MSKRIGLIGGTFDPIHYGHLAIAEEARTTIGLERVLFIPAMQQPLKSHAPAATAQQRFNMVQLACANNEAFEASTIEITRTSISYTVTTLEQLHQANPGDLYFILGADALGDVPRWHNVHRVIELVHFIAVSRPDSNVNVQHLYNILPGLHDRLTLLEGPRLDISSTELRARVAAGKSIRYFTPDPVVEYIREHKLYQIYREVQSNEE
jgi:nicotinate-nucleotide adenylyltransferase